MSTIWSSRTKASGIFALLWLLSFFAYAQHNLPELEIAPGKTYVITDDTLYVGHLRMGDSARIVLGAKHKTHFIKANRITVGRGVVVDGRGARGEHGKPGSPGQTPATACSPGTAGKPGEAGTGGSDGKSLSLETVDLHLAGVWEINLSGGNGGDGGKGGDGGRGGRSTMHCDCHGGDGATGGAGANGGQGGTLTLKVANLKADELLTRIVLINKGGYAGLGGEPGKGGLRGEGTREATSRKGMPGKTGASGKRGSDGPALFQSLVAK